jgi:hypothetical protein
MNLSQFLCEENGNLSAQRLVFVLANSCLWLVWAYVSLKHGEMAPISPELLLGLGIMQAGKVGQKMVEGKAS